MKGRYLKNNPKHLQKEQNPQLQLTQSLTKIVQDYPPLPHWPDHVLGGLYTGPTSISYLFLHLSQTHLDLLIEGHPPKYWCKAYLDGTRSPQHVKPSNCGIINEELAFYAVSAALTKDISYIQRIEKALPTILTDDGSDEWLYGRAGYLYLLRLVRHWVPESAESIQASMDKIIKCILTNGPPWNWHGQEYIGAVHGAIGIITQVVLCDPKLASAVEKTLVSLLDLQSKSGNWPPSTSGTKDLVQFCHGAPGFVLSLVSLRPHFPALQEKVDIAIEKGRQCIWKKGLLTKEPNLCHGTTSNALALASPQSEHFMTYTTSAVMEKGKREGWYIKDSDPFGLYCGEAGRAWGWAVMDLGTERGIIGYSDV
ncbi:hypothetical protein MMC24_002669 [Lignoscripta atroalba]|nr:hypothetical protein [Lignoscripta atroalba]